MSSSRFPQTEAPPVITAEHQTGAPPQSASAGAAYTLPTAFHAFGRWLLRIVAMPIVLAGAAMLLTRLA